MSPRSSASRILGSVEAVALDAYGTVINFTEPDFIAAMAEICADQGLDADATEVWRRFLRAAYLQRAENHEHPVYQRYDEAWAAQFERVFKLLRLDGDAFAAANHLKVRLAEARAFGDAAPAIDTLRAHFPVALLSNADNDFLHACLDANQLTFDLVLSSEDVRVIKPDPEIFLQLAKRMKKKPARVLYVGDNPIPDVLGPARAGMKVAWLNRTEMRKPRKVPHPDVRVRSLAELVRILVPARD
jgi:2-haloalkanoic acid dehalogenase type II